MRVSTAAGTLALAGWMDGWMAVGKSWLAAVMMPVLPLLLACCLAAGEVGKRRIIVFGYLHKGRDREVCAGMLQSW